MTQIGLSTKISFLIPRNLKTNEDHNEELYYKAIIILMVQASVLKISLFKKCLKSERGQK